MKKTIVLLIAAMMLLGAVKGMAAGENFDFENTRISATELNQINKMAKEITQLAADIGNATTDKSQVMTSVSQLEEAANRITIEANKSMDEALIDQAFIEVLKIKEHLIQVRSQL